ncbi:EPIDERMAL PATTERNING FACTOR-like protein 2 [Senna tora]|uniref:Epidermal patterning factor-like protein n=1 Tax=Senna tora TaxID=362788 RepID=A0A834VYB5_9FABA|nr:EPIDERMAL PATTERNING FACTOR-like protein 2 [Senna tora]
MKRKIRFLGGWEEDLVVACKELLHQPYPESNHRSQVIPQRKLLVLNCTDGNDDGGNSKIGREAKEGAHDVSSFNGQHRTQQVLTLPETQRLRRAISSLIEGTKKKGMKVQGVVISAKAQIGSRPPKCERRCTSCGHCEAVQVPIVPQFQSHRSHSAARKPSSSGTPSVTYSSRSDDLSNYKPMSWKCKCGNYFFNP